MGIKKSQSSDSPKNKKRDRLSAALSAVSGEEIRLMAYYNYLNRQKNQFTGSEMTDWLEAESNLLSRANRH